MSDFCMRNPKIALLRVIHLVNLNQAISMDEAILATYRLTATGGPSTCVTNLALTHKSTIRRPMPLLLLQDHRTDIFDDNPRRVFVA